MRGWLDDLSISHREGGVAGPSLSWSVSMSFGGTTHVSLAHDERHPKRLEVISDLAISEEHQAGFGKLSPGDRDAIDRRLVQTLLRRSLVSFHIERAKNGAPKQIAMRAYLPLEGLTPLELVRAIYDVRNTTMDLCVTFQETLGIGDGLALDRALTDPGYTSVVLQRGTLETLGVFQIPGETLDETILRAVRE